MRTIKVLVSGQNATIEVTVRITSRWIGGDSFDPGELTAFRANAVRVIAEAIEARAKESLEVEELFQGESNHA